MNSAVDPVDQANVWDRFNVLWHLLFSATLAIPVIITLAQGDLAWARKLFVLAAAAVLVAGHWLVLARHPEWWEKRLGVMTVYWAVVCGLTAALALQSPSFVITLYGLYPLMFLTMSWWGIVPIVGVTALVGWALGGWGSGQAMITNLLTTAGLALIIAVFVSAISRQSEQRKAALTELAATRAELAESARQTGVLAERERIARELHDTVAQGFTSVVTQLESAEQALEADSADAEAIVRAREHVAKARRTARDSLTEIRQSVRALRPDLLSTATLGEALDRTVRQWSSDTGVPAELRTTGAPMSLSPEIELTLLRAAQEALANTARHASASRVVVSMSYLGDTVTLDVDDDGKGFAGTPRPSAEGGYGLIGMRERIAAVGGELNIESTAGRGTTIGVSVPT